LRVLGRSARG